MFPVMSVVWLPVFVIPVFDRITKLPADKRLTGAGPAACATPTLKKSAEAMSVVTIKITLAENVVVILLFFYKSSLITDFAVFPL